MCVVAYCRLIPWHPGNFPQRTCVLLYLRVLPCPFKIHKNYWKETVSFKEKWSFPVNWLQGSYPSSTAQIATQTKVVFMNSLQHFLSKNFLSFSRTLSANRLLGLSSPSAWLPANASVWWPPVVSLACIYLSLIRGSWAIFGDNNSLISLLICKASNSFKLQETDFLSKQRTIVLNFLRLYYFTNIL